MNELINAGFKQVNIITGIKDGYPNDVVIYHRILKKDVAYQEVRIDSNGDKLAFENSFGNLAVFKIWLGVKQAKNIENLQIKYYPM